MRLLATALLLLSSTAFATGGYFRYPALHDDTLVFTAEGDLWKASVAGGVPKRLTWYGGRAEVVGWSPQGEVLVSTRYFHPLSRPQLVVVSRTSGAQAVVSVENAATATFLDAKTLVYTRDNRRGDNVRAYRGGAVTTLWRFPTDGEVFSEGMRRLGLATLVGKRTAGAGVWLTDSIPASEAGDLSRVRRIIDRASVATEAIPREK